jgi:GNAT superfamily N-acetyltransferase
LVIERLHQRDDLRFLHGLAVEAFSEDAMPFELVNELHWAGREGVFLLRDAERQVQGYVAAFGLRPAVWQALNEGRTDPLEWSPDQLEPQPWQGITAGLYLESIFVRPAFRRRGVALLFDALLSWIETGLEGSEPGHAIDVASLAASPQGASLLKRSLGFHMSMPAHVRRDQMDLYVGRFDLQTARRLLRRLQSLMRGNRGLDGAR